MLTFLTRELMLKQHLRGNMKTEWTLGGLGGLTSYGSGKRTQLVAGREHNW